MNLHDQQPATHLTGALPLLVFLLVLTSPRAVIGPQKASRSRGCSSAACAGEHLFGCLALLLLSVLRCHLGIPQRLLGHVHDDCPLLGSQDQQLHDGSTLWWLKLCSRGNLGIEMGEKHVPLQVARATVYKARTLRHDGTRITNLWLLLQGTPATKSATKTCHQYLPLKHATKTCHQNPPPQPATKAQQQNPPPKPVTKTCHHNPPPQPGTKNPPPEPPTKTHHQYRPPKPIGSDTWPLTALQYVAKPSFFVTIHRFMLFGAVEPLLVSLLCIQLYIGPGPLPYATMIRLHVNCNHFV